MSVTNGEVALDLQADKTEFDELWVLKNNDGFLSFVIIGELDGPQITLFPDSQKILFDGEPVFAPFDERSTKVLVEEIKENNKDNRFFKWPASWPKNVR